jgi:hypothetical protein
MPALEPHTSHPTSRSYVLKLHRDAKPQCDLVHGRLESISTGRSFAIASADELLKCLVHDALDREADDSCNDTGE